MLPKNLVKIRKYFHAGYSYEEICFFMEKKHNLNISVRTLKRILQKCGLKRKCIDEASEIEIATAICTELENGGSNLGYRAMWQRLRKVHKLEVKQKTVARLLKNLDPEGVADRLRHRLKRRVYSVAGPNFLWHIDGYDKLKRFGFAIHACIDGFSKKVIWLKVATSNNDPYIIGYYYMEVVDKYKYVPTLMRADHGTENTLIDSLHRALRYSHNDEDYEDCFLFGKSTHNQRIESYWRQLKRLVAGFFINLFKNMLDERILDIKDPLQIECLRYCFGPLIQRHLENVRKEWNEHRIRKQSPDILGGKPNVIYHWPEKYNGRECKKPVAENHINVLKRKYVNVLPEIHNPRFEELVKFLKPNIVKPKIAQEAYDLYCDLTQRCKQYTDAST